LKPYTRQAGRKSIPKYRRLKTLKSVGRGIWNRNIDQASKEAKKTHWIWKNKGKSNSSTESERKDMIKKKRTLRQVQRQAYASKKDKLISEIFVSLFRCLVDVTIPYSFTYRF
jgi:hypothetical protein